MSTPIITPADRVINIKPSPTLAVNAKAKALKAAGTDILNFSVGEPDFDTPPHVCDAGKKAIDEGFTRYTAVPGMPELREAISQHLKDKGLAYSIDEIQVACGGKHGLYNMFQAVINPGDEVLILPVIGYLSTNGAVLAERRSSSPEQDDFDLNPAILSKYQISKTRAIIINSPSTQRAPSSVESLEAIAKMAIANGWLIITDDIYDTITIWTRSSSYPES